MNEKQHSWVGSYKIPKWLAHRATPHIFVWTLLLVQAYFYTHSNLSPQQLEVQPLSGLMDALLLTSSYAVPVTLHSFLLIKAFFRQRRYGLYFAALFFLLLSSSLVSVPVINYFATMKVNVVQHFFNTASFIIMVTLLEFYRQNMLQQAWFQELQANQAQAELHVLKSQINPHFLFNTLNSIYSLALDRSEHAAEVVLKLGDLMRYMLEQTTQPYVLLSQELAYLENYLWLEKLRLGPRADVQLHVSGSTSRQIAPMLFLPFVENSFKHGVGRLAKQVCVMIVIKSEPESLSFIIENTKPEQPSQRPEGERQPTGLRNVRRRLDLLYPGRHQLELEEQTALYRVRLHIQWSS